jgi:hypothetical protein
LFSIKEQKTLTPPRYGKRKEQKNSFVITCIDETGSLYLQREEVHDCIAISIINYK